MPPPPPPPAPPSYSAQGFSPAEAIKWGWLKFTENVGAVIIAMLALLGIAIALGVLSTLLTGGFATTSPTPEFGSMMSMTSPGDVIAQLIQTVVSIVLGGVAAKAALEVTEGKPFDFFGAFGKVNLVQLIIAGVVVGVATSIGFILLIIPGLIVMFLTYLTTYSIVDDDKSAIDGIKHSVKLTSDNIGDALLLALLNILVVIAGFAALCVGLVVAIPVTVFATAYAYRAFNGQAIAP